MIVSSEILLEHVSILLRCTIRRQNSYEVANFLLVHNNFQVFINDYTGTYNNNPFGRLSAQLESGQIEIRFAPYNPDNNVYLKVYRTAIRDDFSNNETTSLGYLDRIGFTTTFTGTPGVPKKLVSIDIDKYESYGFMDQMGTFSANSILPVEVLISNLLKDLLLMILI